MLVVGKNATLPSTGENLTIKIVSADGSSVVLATSMYREIKKQTDSTLARWYAIERMAEIKRDG